MQYALWKQKTLTDIAMKLKGHASNSAHEAYFVLSDIKRDHGTSISHELEEGLLKRVRYFDGLKDLTNNLTGKKVSFDIDSKQVVEGLKNALSDMKKQKE